MGLLEVKEILESFTKNDITLSIQTQDTSQSTIQSLFNLLKQDMFQMYVDANENGWSDDEKMKELLLDDAHYITLYKNTKRISFNQSKYSL